MSSFLPPAKPLAQGGGDRDPFTDRRGGAGGFPSRQGVCRVAPLEPTPLPRSRPRQRSCGPVRTTRGLRALPRCSERIPTRNGPATPGSRRRPERPFECRRRWYPWRAPQKRWVGATVRLTPPACVPTMVGRATPSSWSPFLRVGARTLRTEQCAKSQCVYPVDIGRCGSPCLSARRSYGKQHRKADPGVLLGEADFPTHEPETGPPKEPDRNQTGAGSNGSLRRV